MNELVERERQAPQTAVATAQPQQMESFVAMLERASRDPEVDVSKLERLMAIHERMLARNAETAFNAALSAMQTELPEMPERGEIKVSNQVRSKYALWEDINGIIKPILSKHGFALTFRTGNTEDGKRIIVTGILSHAAGHSVSSVFALPVDMSGSKNEVQGLGSSTSYGKRYVAGALLNLTSRGEDNDGQGGKIVALTESEKADRLAQIEALTADDDSTALWQSIAKQCAAVGDVAANNELRSALTKRLNALKAQPK